MKKTVMANVAGILVGAVLPILGSITPQAVAQSVTIPSDLEALATRLRSEAPGDPPAAEVSEAPEQGVTITYDEQHPYLLLRQTVDRIDCAAGSRPAESCSDHVASDEQPLFLRAQSRAALALSAYSGMEPNLRKAVSQLRSAARKLPDTAGTSALSTELRAALIETVRRIAVRVIDVATSAGVDARKLEEANAQVAAADVLVAAGDFVKGGNLYKKPLKLGKLYVFDMNAFELAIRGAFASQSVGFAYAINQYGLLAREGGGGKSRLSGESTPLDQDSRKRMQIASVTKNLTAVAVLQLLEKNNISVNTSISTYLPPDWTKGPGLDFTLFRDVLRHESGFDANSGASGSSFGTTLVYSGLQSTIAGGQTGIKTFTYQNVNFALFRVIIPTLFWGGNPVDLLPPDNVVLPGDNPALTSLLYQYYVGKYVLEASGVTSFDANSEWAGLSPAIATETKNYFFPNGVGNTPGKSFGDWTALAGGGGWYLSAYDLAAFMAHVRYDDKLLSKASRALMDSQFFGYNDPSVSNFYASFALGKHGVYRGHGGDLADSGTPAKGMDSCIMNFPEGVQAVVLVNSVGGNYGYQCDALQEAYDSAYLLKP